MSEAAQLIQNQQVNPVVRHITTDTLRTDYNSLRTTPLRGSICRTDLPFRLRTLNGQTPSNQGGSLGGSPALVSTRSEVPLKVSPRGRRIKGSVGEREIVAILQAAGIEARRVPLSGSMSATGFGGDVLVRDKPEHGEARWEAGESRWEVKRRGQGFVRLEKWLEDAEVLAFRADRGEWMCCLRLDYLVDLMRKEES